MIYLLVNSSFLFPLEFLICVCERQRHREFSKTNNPGGLTTTVLSMSISGS